MSSPAAKIILEYVCPILGAILNNLMYIAPLKDLQNAVSSGVGIQSLNPTPWAFMLGNCLGWTAYGVLSKDWYIFASECPGFLLACWLNLGAVKLIYSSHQQRETREALVYYLAKERRSRNRNSSELYRAELPELRRKQAEEGMQGLKTDDDNDDSEKYEALDESYYKFDGGSDSFAINLFGSANSKFTDDIESYNKDNPLRSTVPFRSTETIESTDNKIDLVRSADTNQRHGTRTRSSFRSANGKMERASKANVSHVSFAPIDSLDSSDRSLSVPKHNKMKGMNPRCEAFDTTESAILGPQAPERSMSISHRMTNWATSRSKRMVDWGEIVWDVTAQKTQAETPHEKLVMFMVLLWTVVFSALGFYNAYAPPTEESSDSNLGLTVIGFVVNANQIFFFGAPLSTIGTVVKTKKSDTLHLPSMIANTASNILWTAYAISPTIADPFIYTPTIIGLFFSTIQFICYAIYPRSQKWQDENKRMSLGNMLSESFLIKAMPKSERDLSEGAVLKRGSDTIGNPKETVTESPGNHFEEEIVFDVGLGAPVDADKDEHPSVMDTLVSIPEVATATAEESRDHSDEGGEENEGAGGNKNGDAVDIETAPASVGGTEEGVDESESGDNKNENTLDAVDIETAPASVGGTEECAGGVDESESGDNKNENTLDAVDIETARGTEEESENGDNKNENTSEAADTEAST